MQYNRVILMGRLTRDPETRHTNGGTSVTKFGLAVNEKWGKGAEARERTCFVDCVAWAGLGEVIAKHLRKGDPILLEGALTFSTWETAGEKRSKHEVRVAEFKFVSTSSREEVEEIPF